MLNQKQHKIIRAVLFTVIGGNFACYIEEDAGRIPIVYYALNEGYWSCVVNLLQYMGGHNIGLEHAEIIIGPDTPMTKTALGMCSFFNIRPKRSRIEPTIDVNTFDKAKRYLEHGLPFATFHKVNPREVLERQQLDTFRPNNLGPVPGVSLRSPMQTHLHRIYMAVAFHRVRRKVEAYEKGLAIAAIIVDATNGAVLTIAHNTKNVNVTYHAEANAVQAFLRHHPHQGGMPLILYSTLQPCPLCAAMIAELLPNTMVFYGQTDPGKHMERMIITPKFNFSMRAPLVIKGKRGDEVLNLHVKPLRGYDDWLGTQTHIDIPSYLDQRHQQLKGEGNPSVGRNLYDKNIQMGIGNASRTLDRKLAQYDSHGDQRKPTQVADDNQRSQRRLAIQKVIRHLQPLFSQD